MKSLSRIAVTLFLPILGVAAAQEAAAQSQRALEVRAQQAMEHWTPERRAAAIPRDLVIDERGLGYLRGKNGNLSPYGHDISAQAGKPGGGGGGDTTGPSVSGMSPAAGATVGAAVTFSATVTDASGVKSVTFYVRQGNARAQSFAGGLGANNLWSVNLSGFTNGAWSWYVVANDNAKPSRSTTSSTLSFTVSTGGGGGGGGGTIANAEWTGQGVVQDAVGRIYFEMPDNVQRTVWLGYVCSGTVVNDATTGRSIILTASHCVYDDANKAFARNVLFIPDQAETSGAGTDRNCTNDPIGCWAPTFGVVDVNWTTRTFPNNVHWDYAFYVVKDAGAHSAGLSAATDQLDAAVIAMDVSFAAPTAGSVSHALGYSYSVDPQFMYCADPMQNLNADNWFLPNCGLTGGSSGGPWSQPFNVTTGNGPIISVNSWGYTNQPGMAGPKLSGTTASCVFANAQSQAFGTYADGDAGVKANCP
jgi:hypothetical protein